MCVCTRVNRTSVKKNKKKIRCEIITAWFYVIIDGGFSVSSHLLHNKLFTFLTFSCDCEWFSVYVSAFVSMYMYLCVILCDSALIFAVAIVIVIGFSTVLTHPTFRYCLFVCLSFVSTGLLCIFMRLLIH